MLIRARLLSQSHSLVLEGIAPKSEAPAAKDVAEVRQTSTSDLQAQLEIQRQRTEDLERKLASYSNPPLRVA